METGYDIIFFWIARMILMSTYLIKEIPFEKVYLHGLVRDKQGRKMSKSLGNGIDPLEMSEKYGADAVRLSLVVGTTPGNDLKLSVDKIAGYRNFSNKLWNIARYVLSQPKPITADPEPKTLADKWILSRLNTLKGEVTDDIDNFRLSDAGIKTYEFTWHEFADWYVEIHKQEQNHSILYHVLEELLKLLHPFSPFITEELWSQLGNKNLIIEPWPDSSSHKKTTKAEADFEIIKTTVTNLRNARQVYQIPHSEKLSWHSDNKHLLASANLVNHLTKSEIAKTPSRHFISLAAGKAVFKLNLTEKQAHKLLKPEYQEKAKKAYTDQYTLVNKLSTEFEKFENNNKVPENVVSQKKKRLSEIKNELAEAKKVLDNIHKLSHQK